MSFTRPILKTALLTVIAGGFLMFSGGVTAARADDRDGCYRNVQKWENKLNEDASRHGFSSKQANHDRDKLRDARYTCDNKYGRRSARDYRNQDYRNRDYRNQDYRNRDYRNHDKRDRGAYDHDRGYYDRNGRPDGYYDGARRGDYDRDGRYR